MHTYNKYFTAQTNLSEHVGIFLQIGIEIRLLTMQIA